MKARTPTYERYLEIKKNNSNNELWNQLRAFFNDRSVWTGLMDDERFNLKDCLLDLKTVGFPVVVSLGVRIAYHISQYIRSNLPTELRNLASQVSILSGLSLNIVHDVLHFEIDKLDEDKVKDKDGLVHALIDFMKKVSNTYNDVGAMNSHRATEKEEEKTDKQDKMKDESNSATESIAQTSSFKVFLELIESNQPLPSGIFKDLLTIPGYYLSIMMDEQFLKEYAVLTGLLDACHDCDEIKDLFDVAYRLRSLISNKQFYQIREIAKKN